MSDPPTTIIAERDPLVRDALRVEFSHLGFVVLLAASGPEAEDFASRTIADLAILDVTLPGFSGYDACARIRRQTGYQDTPIVLTAHKRSPRIDAAAAAAGATSILSKPYSFNDLLSTLAPHLRADHPLLVKLPGAAGLGEPTGREWGKPETLEWRFGADSGLSRNGLILRVVRGKGVQVPLIRKP
jgi:DNA-binding response OmpR family regulator